MSRLDMHTIAEWPEIYSSLKTEIEMLEQDPRILEYKEKLEEFEAAREAVKDLAKENQTDIETDTQIFKFVPAYKKWIDYDEAKSLMKNNNQKHLLDSITEFKKTVDMKQFIDLCRAGELPDEARIAAYREEQMAPRVTIADKE